MAKSSLRNANKNQRVRTTRRKRKRKPKKISWLRFLIQRVSLIVVVFIVAYAAILDIQIRQKFEGQKWAIPAHVYTRPLEIYLGQKIDKQTIVDELHELGYIPASSISDVGTYIDNGNTLSIHQRSFEFWDGLRPQQRITILLQKSVVQSLVIDSVETEIVRLEPRLFGSVASRAHEDRWPVKLQEVPDTLIKALISIEDRQFYHHFGVNPFGIARAMLSNLRAGRFAQGGSTLTQQLIKNYYLSSQRTVSRKLKELLMAVLLELHYSKREILEAYINEVYISQSGSRAIHGFALGSQHFFGRPLEELDLPKIALLAGLINGPSVYHPVRHPKRAMKRRNLVLKAMYETKSISLQAYEAAIQAPLMVSTNAVRTAPLSYPAFSGIVRKDLRKDYQQKDLLTEGLKIHTTLDPRVQNILEQSTQKELVAIEKRYAMKPNTLQVAASIIRVDNGEVVAVLGDRRSRFSGYNRVISAQRPIGSLIKPFIYLGALEESKTYSLASVVSDRRITVRQKGSPNWRPRNYDKKEHGDVLLIDALAKSYNLTAVRLGMRLGLERLSDTLHRLGHDKPITPLPSMLLGAVSMSVMDVSQLYLSLATGGFKTPIKTVRAVKKEDNSPLSRYALQVEQVIKPETANMINYALQEVVRSGTARSLTHRVPALYQVAGKTGTTNNYRDSWFVGFSGNYLAVVWVGRDDNQSTRLTGASGAAKIWSAVMSKLALEPLRLPNLENVVYIPVVSSSDTAPFPCGVIRQLPIEKASFPIDNTLCGDTLLLPQSKPLPSSEKTKERSLWKRIFG